LRELMVAVFGTRENYEGARDSWKWCGG